MRYMARLSKEHETIPRMELEGLLATDRGAVLEEQRGNLAVFEAGDVALSRLAMTMEVDELLAVGGRDEMADRLAGLELDGSFAVRAAPVHDEDVSGLEERLGELIKEATGAAVELDAPDTVVRVYVDGEELLVGRQVHVTDRGSFEDRRSHLRPFSSPVSLHPRLARAMVNIAGVPAGGSVLDPFCGTGGILLEAGLAGLEPVGVDADPEMLDGARENLAAYDVEAELVEGDATRLSELFDHRFDAVVSDVPYGRSSAATEEVDELLERFVEEARKVCDGRIVFMADRQGVAGLEPEASLYVHKNLTRYLYVVE